MKSSRLLLCLSILLNIELCAETNNELSSDKPILIDTYLIHNYVDGERRFGGEKHVTWFINSKDSTILVLGLLPDKKDLLLHYDSVRKPDDGTSWYNCDDGLITIGLSKATSRGKLLVSFIIPENKIHQVYDYRTAEEFISSNKK